MLGYQGWYAAAVPIWLSQAEDTWLLASCSSPSVSEKLL